MRFMFASGVRNDLLQNIVNQTFSPVKGRNGKDIGFGYANRHAPHGVTQRLTYTVPANKYAIVSCANINLVREVAATVLSSANLYLVVTPNGGTAYDLMYAYVRANTVESKNVIGTGGTGILHTGDKIELFSVDSSTGGSLHYSGGALITEFDA